MKENDRSHKSHPTPLSVQAVNPFPNTTIFMRAFKWNPFLVFFQGQGTDAVKNGPHGLWVRQDPLLVYQWDVWPHSPRELFYWPLFLGPEQSQKGFSLNNSPTDHYFFKIMTRGEKGGFEKSWSKRNSNVRSHIWVVWFYNCFTSEGQIQKS